jgi:Mg-chelatase subunit ChlI
MRLFQFIAIDGSVTDFDVRKIASGVWTEERSALDLVELTSKAKVDGKTAAVVVAEVDAEAVDWVGSRGFREDDPAKKQIKLYPGSAISLIAVDEV